MLKNEGDIYIKEDKEIKTNTEKKKTFTAWKTECSEWKEKPLQPAWRLMKCNSSVSYTNLLGICAIAIIVNWYTSYLVQ